MENLTLEQKRANIEEWKIALRSGEYKQGRFSLRQVEKNTFCCLGVAYDLLIKKGMVSEWPETNMVFPSETSSKQYGLQDRRGIIFMDDSKEFCSLAKFNDQMGYSFENIAKILDNPPKGLFEEGIFPEASSSNL